jgi:hypothetical protein
VEQPAGVTTWNGPYVKGGVPVDPWNYQYVYRDPSTRAGRDFDLCSEGHPEPVAATKSAIPELLPLQLQLLSQPRRGIGLTRRPQVIQHVRHRRRIDQLIAEVVCQRPSVALVVDDVRRDQDQ